MGGIGMDLNWLETILYGLVSGLTEFLPVSSQAHRTILLNLFGEGAATPVMDLCVHIGALAAAVIACGSFLRRILREYRVSQRRRRRKRTANMQFVYDYRFVKTACIPMLLGFILYSKTAAWAANLPMIALFLAVNGLILHLPGYLASANKDSRNMSSLDGLFFGFASALGVLPGVSRLGAGVSAAVAGGADRQHALKWALVLSIPALLVLCGFDAYSAVQMGLSSVDTGLLLRCLFAGILSFVGAGISIRAIGTLMVRGGIENFSYYCWGAALFAFILYLY